MLRQPDAVPLTATLGDIIFAAVTETAIITRPGRPYPMFRVTILGVTFLLDMPPNQPSLRDIRGASTLHGEPLDRFPIVQAA